MNLEQALHTFGKQYAKIDNENDLEKSKLKKVRLVKRTIRKMFCEKER